MEMPENGWRQKKVQTGDLRRSFVQSFSILILFLFQHPVANVFVSKHRKALPPTKAQIDFGRETKSTKNSGMRRCPRPEELFTGLECSTSTETWTLQDSPRCLLCPPDCQQAPPRLRIVEGPIQLIKMI